MATWKRYLPQIDNVLTDKEHKPTYDDTEYTEELNQALQGLHMSQILGTDQRGMMITPLEAHRLLQENLHVLIKEYDDIFSYFIKGRSMDVPPMEFDVDKKLWEASAHRQISIEKQTSLSTLIDELLVRDVITPSKQQRGPNGHPLYESRVEGGFSP